MSKVRTTLAKPIRRSRGELVPLRAIRKFAREVAERFQPEKIILFGSYAYGTPDEGSDVDMLVIMNTKNRNQASQIRLAVEHGFALDLLVRRPEEVQWRVEAGDWFLREITSKGKVHYETADSRMGSQSRRRLEHGTSRRRPAKAKMRSHLLPPSKTG
jgi:predicted nucleotidyltransferase